MLCRMIGIGVILLAIVGTINLSGSISIFFDLKCLFLVFGVILGGLISKFGISFITNSRKNVLDRIIVIKTARSLALTAGALGALVGFILMLGNLDEPSTIGPDLVVVLLSMFSGVLVNIILMAFDGPPMELDRSNAIFAGGFVSLILFAVFVILLFLSDTPVDTPIDAPSDSPRLITSLGS